jgi:Flp pilus assembly protein TadG
MADCHRAQRNDWCTRNAHRTKRLSDWHQAANRNGQALIEMAFLIPLLVIIIGATISFGLFFYQANTLQQAVDVAAMEISRMPFPATAELGLGDLDAAGTTVMFDANFLAQIYDQKYLVVHDNEWDNATSYNGVFRDYVDTWPLLNRLLVTAMVRDSSYPADGDPSDFPQPTVTRYPGTVVTYTDPATGLDEETVLIPLIDYDSDTGAETIISFIAPVEEIRIDHDDDKGATTDRVGPFSVVKPADFDDPNVEARFSTGMVALRINYPAQSTTLINRTGERDEGGAMGTVVGVNVVQANAENLNNFPSNTNYTLANNSDDYGPHAGAFGLGRGAISLRDSQGNLIYTNGVRPYRKVLSVQAIYRREVFQ